jgi:hypothetical protein
MIQRRLGPPPHANGNQTPSLNGCPDIFELANGDFVLIGRNVTEEISKHLPNDASCGPDECIISVPRKTLLLAKRDIPEF